MNKVMQAKEALIAGGALFLRKGEFRAEQRASRRIITLSGMRLMWTEGEK